MSNRSKNTLFLIISDLIYLCTCSIFVILPDCRRSQFIKKFIQVTSIEHLNIIIIHKYLYIFDDLIIITHMLMTSCQIHQSNMAYSKNGSIKDLVGVDGPQMLVFLLVPTSCIEIIEFILNDISKF